MKIISFKRKLSNLLFLIMKLGNSSLLHQFLVSRCRTVWNGSDLKIYINGILDQSITSSQYFNIYPAPLWIGRSPYYDQPFQGLIDEVCIWNVALTQQQIQLSMNHQLTGIEQGLVGYWRFDEGSGDIVFDKTVNGNNGILNGGTQWVAIFSTCRTILLDNGKSRFRSCCTGFFC